jgi:hypothetical protein
VEPFVEELETVYCQLWSRWVADVKRQGPADDRRQRQAADRPGAEDVGSKEPCVGSSSTEETQQATAAAGSEGTASAAELAKQKRDERQLHLQQRITERQSNIDSEFVEKPSSDMTGNLKTRDEVLEE